MMKVELLSEKYRPIRGSAQAAGFDLCACINDEYEQFYASQSCMTVFGTLSIGPGERVLIKTGVRVAIPSGRYGRIAPRSGLAYKNGIDVLAGVIDSDYRGDVGVILLNTGHTEFAIKDGDRIAQLIIEKIDMSDFEVVESVKDILPSARGEGGFGSTGQ